MRVSVVVPTLNEADTIGQTLTRIRQAGQCELIVVDGGSGDETLEIARKSADRVLSAQRGRASHPVCLSSHSRAEKPVRRDRAPQGDAHAQTQLVDAAGGAA